MRRTVLGLAIALTLTLALPRADAWNSIGHMAVAKLAYDQLDAKQQLALVQLLKAHPHHQAFLAASRPPEIDNEVEWVVLRSAVWPDWIRPRKNDSRGASVTRFHRGEEHYITIPYFLPADEKFFAGKSLVSPDTPNIVDALKLRCNDLRTKNAAAEDRAVAACWIFHLVGDLHQPLHTVSYFSPDPAFAKGDFGGNTFAIKANGRPMRLHTFWDDLLGEDVDYNDDSPKHQAHLYREAVKAADRLRGPKLPDADQDRLAKNRTFESWARESHHLARTVAYQKADGTGLLKPIAVNFNAPLPDTAEEVGPAYIQSAQTTADRQIVLAATRLAERIKTLLTP